MGFPEPNAREDRGDFNGDPDDDTCPDCGTDHLPGIPCQGDADDESTMRPPDPLKQQVTKALEDAGAVVIDLAKPRVDIAAYWDRKIAARKAADIEAAIHAGNEPEVTPQSLPEALARTVDVPTAARLLEEHVISCHTSEFDPRATVLPSDLGITIPDWYEPAGLRDRYLLFVAQVAQARLADAHYVVESPRGVDGWEVRYIDHDERDEAEDAL